MSFPKIPSGGKTRVIHPQQKAYAQSISAIIGPQQRVAAVASGPSVAFELYTADFERMDVYDVRHFRAQDFERQLLKAHRTHLIEKAYESKLSAGYFFNPDLERASLGEFVAYELLGLGVTDFLVNKSGVVFELQGKQRELAYHRVDAKDGEVESTNPNCYFEKSTFENSSFTENILPQVVCDELETVLVGKKMGKSDTLVLDLVVSETLKANGRKSNK